MRASTPRGTATPRASTPRASTPRVTKRSSHGAAPDFPAPSPSPLAVQGEQPPTTAWRPLTPPPPARPRSAATSVVSKAGGGGRGASSAVVAADSQEPTPGGLTADGADPAEDAALQRRSNQVREQLRDAERVYDPVAEARWSKKYRFFSELKMKGTYRTYARARHDPFNKDPAWGKAVLSNVANYCNAKGYKPEEMFQNVDINGDRQLNRPEVKKALCKVLPNLSDQEVIAIFDVIDLDHSGEVSMQEFLEALDAGRKASFSKQATERWRNPIHRIKRVPPAIIEGWEHLGDSDIVQGTRYERVGATQSLGETCDKETSELMERLGHALRSTPRALQHPNSLSKYHYFGGGADMERFRRKDHQRSRQQNAAAAANSAAQQQKVTPGSVPDPGGPDVRPGFLCDPKSAKASGLSTYSPPRSAQLAKAMDGTGAVL
eukprot:TRINITY_DN27519_c0_g1_i1.p1 TRINITY_DN27519_c0_g1~~TRINITY_DN27519_c0_g1_i1.p1  ORF type:complete len:435 (+),score=76.43 TRINITY_DN27519_c0_g1_i1:52-1356(+)